MAVVEITDRNFDREVLGADRPFILDVSASWCGPCKAFEPVFEEVASQMDGRAAFGKISIDANPETPQKLGVTSVPTLIIFKEGEQVLRHQGAMSRDKFVKKLKEQI